MKHDDPGSGIDAFEEHLSRDPATRHGAGLHSAGHGSCRSWIASRNPVFQILVDFCRWPRVRIITNFRGSREFSGHNQPMKMLPGKFDSQGH
jgi:hypothetical protein